MKELWFKGFKRHSGFEKDASVETNLRVMYGNAKLKNPADRWRRVGRQAQSLANLTADFSTKKKAQAVANTAFKKLQKLRL